MGVSLRGISHGGFPLGDYPWGIPNAGLPMGIHHGDSPWGFSWGFPIEDSFGHSGQRAPGPFGPKGPWVLWAKGPLGSLGQRFPGSFGPKGPWALQAKGPRGPLGPLGPWEVQVTAIIVGRIINGNFLLPMVQGTQRSGPVPIWTHGPLSQRGQRVYWGPLVKPHSRRITLALGWGGPLGPKDPWSYLLAPCLGTGNPF